MVNLSWGGQCLTWVHTQSVSVRAPPHMGGSSNASGTPDTHDPRPILLHPPLVAKISPADSRTRGATKIRPTKAQYRYVGFQLAQNSSDRLHSLPSSRKTALIDYLLFFLLPCRSGSRRHVGPGLRRVRPECPRIGALGRLFHPRE